MSDDRKIRLQDVELSEKEAVALRTMFRSPEWNNTFVLILESMSRIRTAGVIHDMSKKDLVDFTRLQGFCAALSEVMSLADVIEDELRQ